VYVAGWNHARRRRPRRRPVRGDDLAVPAATSGIEDRMVVDDLLRRLTARQRAALALRYVGDLPYAQVAATLSCSESTARVTVHQAIERMRT
jgi:RNA polymerase sigma factor (sigma-70 family)